MLDEDDTVGVRGASSRGICYAQKSLEIFDRLGIYERIRAKGITWSVGRTFSGDDEVYTFNLQDDSVSEQPPFINLQQFYLEWFLVDRIRELGAHRPALEEPGDAGRARRPTRVRGRGRDAGRRATRSRPTGSSTPPAPTAASATQLGLEAHPSRSTDRWCISDVRFKKPFADRALDLGRRALQRGPRRLAAPDGRRRLAPRLPDGRGLRPGVDQPARGRRRAAARAARPRRRVRVRLDRPVPVPRPPARRPSASAARSSSATRRTSSARSARAAATTASRTRPTSAGSWRWSLAGRGRRRRCSTATTPSATPRRSRTSPSTSRTARFLAPRSAAEHRMRRAVVRPRAQRHEFARRLANTGRMAQANAYPPSPWAPGGARSVQNVAFDGTTLMRLLGDGTRFLGLWLRRRRAPTAGRLDELAPRCSRSTSARGRCRRPAGRATSAPRAGTLRPRPSRCLRRGDARSAPDAVARRCASARHGRARPLAAASEAAHETDAEHRRSRRLLRGLGRRPRGPERRARAPTSTPASCCCSPTRSATCRCCSTASPRRAARG